MSLPFDPNYPKHTFPYIVQRSSISETDVFGTLYSMRQIGIEQDLDSSIKDEIRVRRESVELRQPNQKEKKYLVA